MINENLIVQVYCFMLLKIHFTLKVNIIVPARPMAPIDEARRILSQVELQRAAADAAQARALMLIGQNLGRLADVAEMYMGMHQNNL